MSPAAAARERERLVRLQNDLADKLSAIPGVSSAALISTMPMEGIAPFWDSIAVEDKPGVPGEQRPMRRFKCIWPGVFQTTGTRLLTGRELTWTDIYDRRSVVVISANIAREIWGTAAAAIE